MEVAIFLALRLYGHFTLVPHLVTGAFAMLSSMQSFLKMAFTGRILRTARETLGKASAEPDRSSTTVARAAIRTISNQHLHSYRGNGRRITASIYI